MTEPKQNILLNWTFHRVVVLSTGDKASAAKTYDLEVDPQAKHLPWNYKLPNTEDFRHRRSNPLPWWSRWWVMKPNFSTPWLLLDVQWQLFENYQNEDGSVTIPEKSCPYMGKLKSSLKLGDLQIASSAYYNENCNVALEFLRGKACSSFNFAWISSSLELVILAIRKPCLKFIQQLMRSNLLP